MGLPGRANVGEKSKRPNSQCADVVGLWEGKKKLTYATFSKAEETDALERQNSTTAWCVSFIFCNWMKLKSSSFYVRQEIKDCLAFWIFTHCKLLCSFSWLARNMFSPHLDLSLYFKRKTAPSEILCSIVLSSTSDSVLTQKKEWHLLNQPHSCGMSGCFPWLALSKQWPDM